MPVGLSGRWVKVFRSFEAHDPIERIEDVVVSAVASDLRRVGGVSGLGQLVGSSQAADAMTAAIHVELKPMTGQVDRLTSALAMILIDHLALKSPPQAAQALVERAVSHAVLSRLDRMVHHLVGDRKYDAADLHQHFKRVLSGEQMAKLIQRLLRHPSGKGLRAPNKKFRPLPQNVLMDNDLDNL